MLSREVKWDAARLAYTAEQRTQIMKCIQRLNTHESHALGRIAWDKPAVRAAVRDWFYAHWRYLVKEYETVLPHVDELPDE